MSITVRPASATVWKDVVRLFGSRGACAGCWCMWWRQSTSEFERHKGPANRRALQHLVKQGPIPGLIAYRDGVPVGWCAVAPRISFPRLARSRILAPLDGQPVWSIVCFFVDRQHRRQGVSRELLEAAKAWVREQGGTMLEGYPVDPVSPSTSPLFIFTGIASVFRAAGFKECARRSPTRPIMRIRL